MARRREVAIAVDAGTSGARAVAVDIDGRVVAQVRRSYRTRVPRPGWAEQDPRDWSGRAIEALTAVADTIRGHCEVVAIGLTGQCPTVAGFDRHGVAVTPGLMYSDGRAVAETAEMRAHIGVERMHRLTGHVAEAFHVGPKILWLRTHEPALFASVAVFLQPRDVVLRALTGVVGTDETHANATLFYDLRERRWSDELLEAFELDCGLFPEALSPATVAGTLSTEVATSLGLPRVPVVIGAGDSQCAAFGAGVVAPGPASEMAGASTCINTSVEEPLAALDVTHYSQVVPTGFSTEVGLNTAGAALEWGRSRLGFARHRELEARATSFRGRWRARHSTAEEVAPLFLPFLADGERTDPRVRGAFLGLAARHDDAALGFAVIEGVALAVAHRVESLRRAGAAVSELRTSGGGSRHRLLAQVKADLLGIPVLRLAHDATAVGCALLAASSNGYADESELAIDRFVQEAQRSLPDDVMAPAERRRLAWFEELLPMPAVHVMEDAR